MNESVEFILVFFVRCRLLNVKRQIFLAELLNRLPRRVLKTPEYGVDFALRIFRNGNVGSNPELSAHQVARLGNLRVENARAEIDIPAQKLLIDLYAV